MNAGGVSVGLHLDDFILPLGNLAGSRLHTEGIQARGNRLGKLINALTIGLKTLNDLILLIEQGKGSLSLCMHGEQARVYKDHQLSCVEPARRNGDGVAARIQRNLLRVAALYRNKAGITGSIQGHQIAALRLGMELTNLFLILIDRKSSFQLFRHVAALADGIHAKQLHLQRCPICLSCHRRHGGQQQ